MKNRVRAAAAALLLTTIGGCSATVREHGTPNSVPLKVGESYQGAKTDQSGVTLPTPPPNTDTSGPHQVNIVVRDRGRTVDPNSIKVFVPQDGKSVQVIVSTE